LFKIIYEMDERTRKILEAETDPNVLRALLFQATDFITSQKELIKKLEIEQAERDQRSFAIEEKLKLIRRSIFGRSSETRVDASDRPRTRSQSENLIFSQAAFPTNEVRDESGQRIKTRWANLETEEVEVALQEEDFEEEAKLRQLEKHSSEKWSDMWEEIPNAFDRLTQIEVIERRYVKKIYKKKKYKLKEHFTCQIDDKDLLLTAEVPGLLPGMNYTTNFVAAVVSDKYISHTPLERQVRQMESLGLKGMRNSTLSRLCAVAASVFEPMQGAILDEILRGEVAVHIDETPWGIQNKHERDGYMWIISNRAGSYYFFKPTRSAKILKDKLTSYTGPVVTDGLETYDKVLSEAKIPHAYCWAHARREFFKLEGHDPSVTPILDLIDKLFEVERKASTFTELKELRKLNSTEIVKDLKKLLLEEYLKSRVESQKRKAILYIESRWPGFEMFLTDHRIPLSNNEAERTIRHAVVGRKNYYGSGSHTGAETAATLFTIIESCKKNDIDPRTFLTSQLNRLTMCDEIETPLQQAKRLRQYR
jgi:hypothetical protein